MNPSMVSFEYYVQAYRAFARALNIEVEQLWRALWQKQPGAVRAAFVETAATVLQMARGQELAAGQRIALRGLADSQFHSGRVAWAPNEQALFSAWQVIL
jgi:hypothetical protein